MNWIDRKSGIEPPVQNDALDKPLSLGWKSEVGSLRRDDFVCIYLSAGECEGAGSIKQIVLQ